MYATVRDFARFGWLHLQDGCWNGERLLPEGWVTAATSVTDAYRSVNVDGEDDVQGRQWWLNVEVPEVNVVQPWPKLPGDTYAALGHWGQSIYVIPSENVVVVRVADDRDGTFDREEFVRLALEVGKAP